MKTMAGSIHSDALALYPDLDFILEVEKHLDEIVYRCNHIMYYMKLAATAERY